MVKFVNRPVCLKPIAIVVIYFRHCNFLKKRPLIKFLISPMVFQIPYNTNEKKTTLYKAYAAQRIYNIF